MAERVELELFCLPQGNRVAVALHLRVAGTPVRSFASPLHSHCQQQRAVLALDASAAHLAAALIAGEALEAAPSPRASGGQAAAAAAAPTAEMQQPPDGLPAAETSKAAAVQAVSDAEAELVDAAAGPTSLPASETAAAAAASPASGTGGSGHAPGQQQQPEQQQPEEMAAAPPPAAAAAGPPGAAASDAGDGAAEGAASGSAASLDAVMGMLQQLLASSVGAQQQAVPPEQVCGLAAAPSQQPQQAPEPAPSAHSCGSAGVAASSSALPSGSVEKLLALELEVGDAAVWQAWSRGQRTLL